jgi:ABC-type dipeptide/oligopeptide/nickel transport system permease component
MSTFIVRRLVSMVAVLISVSIVTFLLMHAAPGGPFDRAKKLPQAVIDNVNAKFHLDDPLVAQYIRYMGNVVLPRLITNPTASEISDYLVNIKLGDITLQWMNFGPSYKSPSRSVNDIFRDNLPVSFSLGILALLVAIIIGIPAGIIAALGHNRWPDFVATSVAVLGSSLPSIVLGPLLIIVFGLSWRLLPVSGWGTAAQAILPVFTLGLGSGALIARLTRASLLEVLNEDYIRTARAKGLRGGRIVNVHALKNAMIPVTTVIGPLFAGLVTGSFVVETVFGIPGMGKYFVNSISDRDYPVIMGTVLLFAMILVVANFLVDLAYGWLDPRIGFAGASRD